MPSTILPIRKESLAFLLMHQYPLAIVKNLILFYMYLYRWRGINKNGSQVRGRCFAQTYNDLEQKLSSQSIIIISANRPLIQQSISRNQWDSLFEHLAHLLSAYIPLHQSLSAFESAHTHPYFKEVVHDIAQQVLEGHSLSQVLHNHRCDDPCIFALISAGEATGTLGRSFQQIVQYREYLRGARQQLFTALIAPGFTFVMGLLMIVSMCVYVIPLYKRFFSAFDEVPPVALKLFLVSDFLSSWSAFYWFFGIFFCLFSFFYLFKKRLQRLLFFMPFYRSLYAEKVLRIVAFLLAQAIPVTQALEIAQHILPQAVKATVCDIKRMVERGSALSDAWSCSYLAAHDIEAFLKAGEMSGHLAELVLKAADREDRRIKKMLDVGLQFVQPSALVGVGICIACFAYAMYVPLIELSATIKI